MGLNMYWHVPERLFITYFWGDMTVAEMERSNDWAHSHVKAGTPLVHNIADMRELTSYPKNLSLLIKTLKVFKDPDFGWLLLVTDDRMIEFMSSVLAQLSDARFRAFQDPDEAIQFLNYVDSTMPNIAPYELLKTGENRA